VDRLALSGGNVWLVLGFIIVVWARLTTEVSRALSDSAPRRFDPLFEKPPTAWRKKAAAQCILIRECVSTARNPGMLDSN
jgi:hypothetical protein